MGGSYSEKDASGGMTEVAKSCKVELKISAIEFSFMTLLVVHQKLLPGGGIGLAYPAESPGKELSKNNLDIFIALETRLAPPYP